jgi:NADH-quinone oxidoreductase subunit G
VAAPAKAGKGAREIAAAAVSGEITTLYLLHADPVRDYADRRLWEGALATAEAVVAHASLLSDALRETATVVFPAESYAEKEGTIVNLDGRVQRLRPAIGRPGAVRAEWQVLADVAKRVGLDTGALSGPMVTRQVVETVPFYAGLTLEEIGGKGVRWQEREAAAAAPAAPAGPFEGGEPLAAPRPNGALRLGTYRSIWASPEVEVSPSLKFLAAKQQAELSPLDADRLGVENGEKVTVSAGDASVLAQVFVRGNIPAGTIFLAEATAEQSATELLGEEPRLVEVRPA